MGLGLPGMKVDGPLFLTGEPRREYEFLFRLAPSDNAVKPLKWYTQFFDTMKLLYISGLAEKVTFPPIKFSTNQVMVSTLQCHFPKGFDLQPLSVQYIEDELESVFRFHLTWQNNIRGTGTVSYTGGLQFEPLGKVCCKILYAPSKKMSQTPFGFSLPIGLDMPMGGDVFPYVFPVDVQKTGGNKNANGISKTTVTYIRVPNTTGWSRSESLGDYDYPETNTDRIGVPRDIEDMANTEVED